jgi:hypothetical protein
VVPHDGPVRRQAEVDVRRRSIRTTLVMGLVLAAFAGACGGDDAASERTGSNGEGSSATVERDTWAADLDQACDELNRDYEQLATADPGDRDEAIAYARDVDAFAASLVEVLADAGVPSEGRDGADELVGLVDDLATAATDLAAAAQDGDVAGVTRAIEQLERIGADVNDAATALDVPACGGF